MKSIVLAAGYATRLYPLTENFPKPLLEIGGVSILDRMIKDIDRIEEIDEHIIISNHKFFHHFEEWKNKSGYIRPITILNDGSTDNEHRLGAVKDLLLAIETGNLRDDLLVVAADNILDFSLSGFVRYFKEKQTSLIMMHHEPSIPALQRTGVVSFDDNRKVLELQEKPKEPKSHYAVPPFYIYKKDDISHIKSSVDEGCHTDAPGSLASHLLKKTTLHVWEMPGTRFDIGTMESYYQMKE